jgi:rubrerythrin
MDELSTEALDYLSLGIKSEIAAYVFYKSSAKKMEREALKKRLLEFADQERGHFLSLEKLYDRYVRSEKWVTYRDLLSKDGIPDIDETIGEKHVRRIAQMNAATSALDILNIALEFEKEARQLYVDGAGKANQEDVKKTFEFLANFELGHVKWVEELIAAETRATK